MENHAQVFDKIIHHRRAIRIFDETAYFDETLVKRSLERAVLSPNSSNLQLWEFVHIQSPEIRAKLIPACLGQNAAKTAREMVAIVVRRDLWQERCTKIIEQQTTFFKSESGGELTAKHHKLLGYWKTTMPLIHKSGFGGVMDVLKKCISFFTGLKKPTLRQVTSKDARLSAHRSIALAAQTFMLSIAAEGYDSCPMEGFDSQRVHQLLGLEPKAEIAMLIAVGTRTEKGVYGGRICKSESAGLGRAGDQLCNQSTGGC